MPPSSPSTDARFNSERDLETLLPVIYREGRVVAAVYFIDPNRARSAVKPPELHPLLLPGPRALAVVSWFDYAETSIGAYREFAVGVVVSPHRRFGAMRSLDVLSTKPDTGAWLLSLPVSSELACRGGVELFGYPKRVCRINVEYSSKSCTGFLEDEGALVLRSSISMGWGPRFPVRRLVTYSEKAGQLLRTCIETRWLVTVSSGRGTRLQVASPQHPVALALHQLALPEEPSFVLHGGHFRAILNAGKPI